MQCVEKADPDLIVSFTARLNGQAPLAAAPPCVALNADLNGRRGLGLVIFNTINDLNGEPRKVATPAYL